MQSLISAMTTFRKAFLNAILKSLLRGRSLLEALLAYWIAPQSLSPARTRGVKGRPSPAGPGPYATTRSLDDFLDEARELFLSPIGPDGLRALSIGLKAQFCERLQTSPECMLPSFNHLLPTGRESGQYLAIDVGGSTLRVALVELKAADREDLPSSHRILGIMSFKIDAKVKSLEGMAFFDWMADRIVEIMSKGLKKDQGPGRPLPVSLAWSFPVEQTSMGGGRIHGMGKGFLAANGLLGQDLGQVIQFACAKKGLDVEVGAILNDSSAALLSQAYSEPTTRFSLILGTGMNIAAYLPVRTIGRAKFGDRPAVWFDEAQRVIVNTELGMFGGGILPLTRWDQELKKRHPRPDFQPMEHLVSGLYLGEVCRVAMVEAVETAGLLGGVLPPSLTEPYALDTETVSIIEGDTSTGLEKAMLIFKERHPSTVEPTPADMRAIRKIASFVSRRSSAVMAASVYTLWELRAESEEELMATFPSDSPFARMAREEARLERTVLAFNGSVIEHYPGYREMCQAYVDGLIASGAEERRSMSIALVEAKESSLIGAAVALGCVDYAR